MIRIIDIRDLDDNKGLCGVEGAVISSNVWKTKKSRLMGFIKIVDKNNDSIKILFFNNPK